MLKLMFPYPTKAQCRLYGKEDRSFAIFERENPDTATTSFKTEKLTIIAWIILGPFLKPKGEITPKILLKT